MSIVFIMVLTIGAFAKETHFPWEFFHAWALFAIADALWFRGWGK
jgi:hypothetical protein